jgi:hypothetical protein
VVAQTFSPFSRFPAERRRTPTISEYLNLTSEPYAAVGLTRSFGGGRVSREVVGRILRRLYAYPLDSTHFANSLENIGFLPKLVLRYSKGPVAEHIDFYASRDDLYSNIRIFLQNMRDRSTRVAQDFPLMRELSGSDDADKLATLLVDSIETVREKKRQSRSRNEEYGLELDVRSSAASISARELYAFLVLIRTGFIRMKNCYVRPLKPGVEQSNKLFEDELAGAFDITEASSGQQQLISSLFGIAAELEDDALLVIDEPELSLHPAWQSSYLDRLNGLLRARKGCEVFIATHSPLIAQRARELGFGFIDLDSPTKSRMPVDIKKRNREASVDQTLLENFNVPVRDSVYVARLILSLVMGAERGNLPVKPVTGQLESLQKLYEAASQRDEKTEKLLRDALALVKSASEKPSQGKAS